MIKKLKSFHKIKTIKIKAKKTLKYIKIFSKREKIEDLTSITQSKVLLKKWEQCDV